MIPGQLGPIKRDLDYDLRIDFTLSMSSAGIPSVMQTISSISAAIASSIASAACGAGTYITEASQSVYFFASSTVPKIGRLKCFNPAFLAFTPPTILVPYAIACSVWNVP